jgi:hypothetical protein
VLCCILATLISSNTFIAIVMEIEVSRRGKELDLSQGRKES